MKSILIVGLLLVLGYSQFVPKMVNKLMPLTHSSSRDGKPIERILLHFSSLADESPEHLYDVEKQVRLYIQDQVSAHYLLDREGVIYLLVDPARKAWHAGKGYLNWYPHYKDTLNFYAIGIEMLGTGDWEDMKIFMSKEKFNRIKKQDLGYTDKQYAALKWLLDTLSKKYHIPYDRCHIFGHSEWQPGSRTDPGHLFDYGRIGLPAWRRPGQCEPQAL